MHYKEEIMYVIGKVYEQFLQFNKSTKYFVFKNWKKGLGKLFIKENIQSY